MYRFLVPMEKIMADDTTRAFYENELPGFVTFYRTEVGRPGLLLPKEVIPVIARNLPIFVNQDQIGNEFAPKQSGEQFSRLRRFYPSLLYKL